MYEFLSLVAYLIHECGLIETHKMLDSIYVQCSKISVCLNSIKSFDIYVRCVFRFFAIRIQLRQMHEWHITSFKVRRTVR